MTKHCTTCGLPTNQEKENLWVCDSGHNNWANPTAGSIVYVIKDNKVIYGVRSVEPNSGKLSLPGGFIEIGESAENTATREVKEELGIDVEIIHYLGSYPSEYTSGKPSINLVFVAKYIAGEINYSDDMNGGEPVWYSVDSLPDQNELAWSWYEKAQRDFTNWLKSHSV
ncbi:MAG: NUDIX domain-containing protein [Candidatus Saccharibacteria bacterium]|nr:NUDIX domain-containing protein [Candidatus Saccharibacteria bacterium]